MINEKMYDVFHKLIRMKGEVRHLTLDWLAKCLHANKGECLKKKKIIVQVSI